jgi:pimeloyl-ACP methyl ester carboxylesterase
VKQFNSVLLVFLLTLAFLLARGQGTARAQDALPDPPGELINIGGHNLHIYCIGEGSPTVILETGSGVLSLTWYPLQERIAAFTRVCSYDRAGYGWSDPGPTPRTTLQMAAELEALLKNAGVVTPVILAGHSMGGMIVRYFAATHPDLVVGVVLVDATPPMMTPTVRAEIPEFDDLLQAEASGYDQIISVVRSGRWTARDASRTISPGLPRELVEPYTQLMTQPSVLEAIYAEYVAFNYNMEQTRAAGDLGDIPLIVLAGRNAPIPEGWADRAWERWIDFQEEQASLSTISRFEVLDSGHYIYIELPDTVVEAVRELVEGARAE